MRGGIAAVGHVQMPRQQQIDSASPQLLEQYLDFREILVAKRFGFGEVRKKRCGAATEQPIDQTA